MFLNEINCREQKGKRTVKFEYKKLYEGGGGGGGWGLSWNTMARAANPMIIFQARVRNLNKTCSLSQASFK